jgi:hypothetical protein
MGPRRGFQVGRAAWILAWLLAAVVGVLSFAIDRTGKYSVHALGIWCCVLVVFALLEERRLRHS